MTVACHALTADEIATRIALAEADRDSGFSATQEFYGVVDFCAYEDCAECTAAIIELVWGERPDLP